MCVYVLIYIYNIYLGDRRILHILVRGQINIILSRESLCCLRIQKEDIDHLTTDKNQPLISVLDLSRAIKKTVWCKQRGFSPGSPVFPSLKNSILNSSSIRSVVDVEPLLKVLFVLHLYFYLFIYYYCYFLFIHLFLHATRLHYIILGYKFFLIFRLYFVLGTS